MDYSQLAGFALQVLASPRQVRDLSVQELQAVLAVHQFLQAIAQGTLVVGKPVGEQEDGSI